MKKIKGVAVIEAVVVLGLITTAVYIGKTFFAPTAGSANHGPIKTVNDLKADEAKKVNDVQNKIDTETKKQLSEAQAAVHATGEALNQVDNKVSSGKDASREVKTAIDINNTAKIAIDAGIGTPVDPKLMQWFIDSINKKNSEIERERQIGEKMLQSKHLELTSSIEREQKAIEERVKVEVFFKEKLTKAEADRDEWALKNEVQAKKYEKIMFFVSVGIGLYLLALVAPLAAKLFPALSGISNVVSAIVAPTVQWSKSKIDDRCADLVSLVDNNKKFIETIDPQKVKEFKKHLTDFWENDHHAQSEIEQIKKKLRI
jgi:hypothetical protein